jgi:hypothetical protein
MELAHHEPLNGKVALIDGDILAYRCAFAAEKTRYYVPTKDTVYEAYKDIPKDVVKEAIWSQKEIQPVEFALQALKTTIEWIVDVTRCRTTVIYLSGRNNFRYDLAVTLPYKGNRETQGKPTHHRACVDYMKHNCGAITTDGYEADDALGIDAGRFGEECFICTIDKDLDQLPGWKFNWVNDLVYRVSPRDGDYALYRQIIAGDSTDNVPGIRGYGSGKAGKLLDGCQSRTELFSRTWDLYKGQFPTSAEAWRYFREQAGLVYILRKYADEYTPPYIPEEAKEAEDEFQVIRGTESSGLV